MTTTAELLAQYRAAYNMTSQQIADSAQSTAPTAPDPFKAQPKKTYADHVAEKEAQASELFKRSTGFNTETQNPEYYDNEERRKLFDDELSNSSFMSQHKERFETVLGELREEMLNPNSPLDEQGAIALFQKIMNEEFKGGA